jgi:F-type H+-transporting ATPase subunit c
MKSVFRMLWVLLAVFFVASVPMFAADKAAAVSIGTAWKPALGGFAMAIASGLCGLGQGKATASAAEAIARNPGAVAAIRGALILGLVLIESLALYTLVIVFIL